MPVVTITVAAADFGVGATDIGLAIAVFTGAMAATSVPAGIAGDRWGTSVVLTAYFWALGLAATACGLSTDYDSFLVGHALLGAAAGLFHPAGLGLLSLTVEPERLGHSMGLFGVFGSVGVALTPLAVNTSFGWRSGFLAIAAVAFAAAVGCHLLRASGRMLPGVPPAEALAAAPSGRGKGLGFLLLAMGANGFLLDGFMPLFPETILKGGTLLIDERTLMFVVLAVGGVGQYIGGILARDSFAASRYAVLVLLQPLVLLSVAYGLSEPAWPYMLMGSFAFLSFMTQPIENKLMASYTSARRRSSAFALKFVVSLALATPAPWLIARLLDQEGWGFAALYRLLALTGMAGVFGGVMFLRARRVQRVG